MNQRNFNFIMPDFFNLPNNVPRFLCNESDSNFNNNIPYDKKNSKEKNIYENICPICYEQIKNKCFIEDCNHQFCKECIIIWRKTKDNCPLCRAKINNIISVFSRFKIEKGHTKKIILFKKNN